MNRDLLMHTSIAMEIGEATCDIVPVWWYFMSWLPWVTVHADIVQRVRTTKPTERGRERERDGAEESFIYMT